MTRMDDFWSKALQNPGVPVDIGNIVVCDLCYKDYTDLDDKGGFVLDSKGVCPSCSERVYKDLEIYGELDHIRAKANEGESFRVFILRIRNSNKIQITTF